MKRAMLLLLPLTACAYANGYDPSRYTATTAASIDPETEPLPPSPKRSIIDPRGTAIVTAPDAAILEVSDAAAPAIAACGTSRANLCPLQAFMHGEMSTAHTAATLTTAFTLAAGMSPDDAWGWTAIATRGAELANAGNLAAAKAQCAACHDVYRDRYVTQYRTRPL